MMSRPSFRFPVLLLMFCSLARLCDAMNATASRLSGAQLATQRDDDEKLQEPTSSEESDGAKPRKIDEEGPVRVVPTNSYLQDALRDTSHPIYRFAKGDSRPDVIYLRTDESRHVVHFLARNDGDPDEMNAWHTSGDLDKYTRSDLVEVARVFSATGDQLLKNVTLSTGEKYPKHGLRMKFDQTLIRSAGSTRWHRDVWRPQFNSSLIDYSLFAYGDDNPVPTDICPLTDPGYLRRAESWVKEEWSSEKKKELHVGYFIRSKTIHELVELASIRTARDPSFINYDLQRSLVKLPEPIELPKIQKLKDAMIIDNKKVFHRCPPGMAGKENEIFRVSAAERDPPAKWGPSVKTPNHLYLENPNVSVVEVTLNARMELTGYRKKEFGASGFWNHKRPCTKAKTQTCRKFGRKPRGCEWIPAWVELFRRAEGLVWDNGAGGFVHAGERHGTWL